jgi:hypothetical protein
VVVHTLPTPTTTDKQLAETLAHKGIHRHHPVACPVAAFG